MTAPQWNLLEKTELRIERVGLDPKDKRVRARLLGLGRARGLR